MERHLAATVKAGAMRNKGAAAAEEICGVLFHDTKGKRETHIYPYDLKHYRDILGGIHSNPSLILFFALADKISVPSSASFLLCVPFSAIQQIITTVHKPPDSCFLLSLVSSFLLSFCSLFYFSLSFSFVFPSCFYFYFCSSFFFFSTSVSFLFPFFEFFLLLCFVTSSLEDLGFFVSLTFVAIFGGD